MRYACCILLLALLCNNSCFSQDVSSSINDSSVRYYWVCKQRIPVTLFRSSSLFSHREKVPAARVKLFSADGEMSYQHFNRNAASDDLLLINSSSDIATLKLNVVYKEAYPFALSLRYNKANPFQLDDQYEVNLGFDERSFRQRLLEKINYQITSDFQQKRKELLNKYEQAHKAYQREKQFLASPVAAQRIIKERLSTNLPSAADMQELRTPGIDSLSVPKDLPDITNWKEQAISKKDSLEKLVRNMEDSLADMKTRLAQKLDSANSKVAGMKSLHELRDYADSNDTKGGKRNNLMDVLMRTNLRVGKFILSNSELTVSNIFLHGASIKYGNEKFVILSGGLYDFAFRQVFNFRSPDRSIPKTSVFAVKVGKTDGNNLSAVSLYTGKKTKRGSVNEELETVTGISVEKRVVLNRNFTVNVEIAKSTTLLNGGEKKETTLKDLFGTFSTKTIGIYNSIQAYFPKTSTDAELNYRYWGQQFQSFNASQYFNPQNNISGRVSQPFFKRKLYITAGGRYTDFRTTGIASNIHTKTIFASTSATIRIKKLPIVTLGYYPGSQVYILDKDKLYEYFYYIFNTTASHYFNAGKMPMQVVVTYNKFFNKYSDSLVSGSQSYYNIFWTAWRNKFSYLMNFSRQETEWNVLNTIEAGINYAGKVVKLGGSVKYNVASHSPGIGYSLNGGISLGRIGTINLIYDKSFLPGRDGAFIPVGMGQVQIIKPLKFSVWQ